MTEDPDLLGTWPDVLPEPLPPSRVAWVPVILALLVVGFLGGVALRLAGV